MMKALSFMQWLVSWGQHLILETRLWRTLVDGPVLNRDYKTISKTTESCLGKLMRPFSLPILVEVSTTLQAWLRRCPIIKSSLWSLRPSSRISWIVGHKCSRIRPAIVGLYELFPRRIWARGNVIHYIFCLHNIHAGTFILWYVNNNAKVSKIPFLQDLCCCQNEP